MANYTLTADSPLNGLQKQFDGVLLQEVTSGAIVSISIPLAGEEALAAAVTAAYGVALPLPGKSVRSEIDGAVFLGMARDQFFVFFNTDNLRPVEVISEKLGTAGYYTDQSDSWVKLEVIGEKSREALERICPVNLDPDIFLEGDMARTTMEHMGSIIVHQSQDNYLLCSARSSAHSFAHAIELSIKNVI